MTTTYNTASEQVTIRRTDGTPVWGAPPPDPEPDPWPLPTNNTQISLTTYDGSNATCHPSVVDMLAETGDVWGGYRWWLADTPYVDPAYPAGSSIENPCIWASNDRVTWVEPGEGVNPLEPWPGGGLYNSDTELVWDSDGERLIMYWRRSNERLHAATSTDGTDWTLHGEILALSGLNVSPTVVRLAADDWRLWTFTESSAGLHRFQADNPLGPWTSLTDAALPGFTNAWHGSITVHEGALVGVADVRNGNAARPFISVDDGATFAVGAPRANLNGYRSCLVASTRTGYLDSWHGQLGLNRPRYRLNPVRVWTDLL